MLNMEMHASENIDACNRHRKFCKQWSIDYIFSPMTSLGKIKERFWLLSCWKCCQIASKSHFYSAMSFMLPFHSASCCSSFWHAKSLNFFSDSDYEFFLNIESVLDRTILKKTIFLSNFLLQCVLITRAWKKVHTGNIFSQNSAPFSH